MINKITEGMREEAWACGYCIHWNQDQDIRYKGMCFLWLAEQDCGEWCNEWVFFRDKLA